MIRDGVADAAAPHDQVAHGLSGPATEIWTAFGLMPLFDNVALSGE